MLLITFFSPAALSASRTRSSSRAGSGAFGVGSGGGPFGGGSLVERNLDRWTVVFAVLFVANVLALLKI